MALCFAIVQKRTDAVLRRNRPCLKTKLKSRSLGPYLVLSCLPEYHIGMRRVTGTLERGDSTQWGGHQRAQPVSRSRTHPTFHEFAKGIPDILSVQSFNIRYEADILCLAVGQTLKIQRCRQCRVVSLLGAWGIPENGKVSRDQGNVLISAMRLWNEILKLAVSQSSDTGFRSGWYTPLSSIWH